MKNIIIICLTLLVFTGGYFLLHKNTSLNGHKNISYVIDGDIVTLKDGFAETTITQDSESSITTHYFGNELITDLNDDGLDDIAFILTQERGGSGVFFYAVAALKTEDGYVGSDGYFLGDRISPQNTTVSPNPSHKNVVVFNYAERAEEEPMTTAPSMNQSVYLKIDTETMQWGIVMPDFEGESR